MPTAIMLKNYFQFMLILILFVGSSSCHICKKKTPSASATDGLIIQGSQAPPPVMVAYYRTYQTAMGKGRGIQFTITLPKNTFDTETRIDSLQIGGKNVSALVRQWDPCIVEGNYLVNDPEPTVEVPNPKRPHDSLIDEHVFEPALLSYTQNGSQKSVRINRFIEKKK